MHTVEPGLYQHFKGTTVNVLFSALDSETQEEMVVYEHREDGQKWVRPLSMFLENVTRNGKTMPRFTKL